MGKAVLAKIAAMPGPDRALGERLHAIIKAKARSPCAATLVGMPAYAKDGKVVCFFQSAEVQDEVRDVRLHATRRISTTRHVADRLPREGVDCRRRGKDRCALVKKAVS